MKFYYKIKPVTYLLVKVIVFLCLIFSRTEAAATEFLNDPQVEEDAICGVWYTNNNNSKVEIYNKNGSYYGKIIWLKDPNKSIYTNKLVILDMSFNQDRRIWENGTLYYPVKDAQYKGFIEMPNRDTLLIRAYIGSPIMGKTITWVRAKQ